MKLPTAHLHKPHITVQHIAAAGCAVYVNTGWYGLCALIGVPLMPSLLLGVGVLGGSIMAAQEYLSAHSATPEN